MLQVCGRLKVLNIDVCEQEDFIGILTEQVHTQKQKRKQPLLVLQVSSLPPH